MTQLTGATRDLLFGLIALQNGLIDHDQLLTAFEAWSRDEARPLADHLVDLGHVDPDALTAVQTLVASHLAMRGEDPGHMFAEFRESPAARESLARIDAPHLQATLSHHDPGPDVRVGHNGSRARASDSATAGGRRFRPLRHHACGGLGTVSIALDAELNREVALKRILDQYADDPYSRARFVREAEITGGLEHPGVVPVYALGQDADGRPYYAMRFVRGITLKQAIDAFHSGTDGEPDHGRRSLERRKLLRRFLDVCHAVDYAHSRGVLHRDLKPGNVIVGNHGETLVVDWGLAKATGHGDPDQEERAFVPCPASGSGAETRPGFAIGTPAFMSPEQARGDLETLGPHSDVYSLGVTLYYLLTGRLPFDQTNLDSMLRAVQRADYPRCRALDPSLDRALEAVCFKAMAADPRDRYPTARLLAEDVERWMADEPVLAWREPPTRRLLRWARRRRTAVVAATATALVALIGTVAVLAVQTRANVRLRHAYDALLASSARESARFQLARDAIRLFHGEVSEDLLLKQAQFQDLRTKLLHGAADFYGRLEAALEGQRDRASRRMLGQSYNDLGELTSEIGHKVEALALHLRALAVRRALASGPDADAAARLDVARSLLATGHLQHETGDDPGALATFDEARRLAEPLVGSAEAGDEARAVLGLIYFRMSFVMNRIKGPVNALEPAWKGVTVLRELASTHPDADESQRDLALCLNHTANLLWQLGGLTEQKIGESEALAIRHRLAAAHPDDPRFQRHLEDTQNELTLWESDRLTEALEVHREALAIRRRLAEASPSVPQFQRDLANTQSNIGVVWERMDRPAEALEVHREALAIRQSLAVAYPAVSLFQGYLGHSHENIGLALSRLGRTVEALAANRAALTVYVRLVDDHPEVPEYLRHAARVSTTLGKLHRDEHRTDEAAECFRQAAAHLERLPNLRAVDYLNLIGSHALLAAVADQPGSGHSAGEAEEARERAMHWLRRATASHPGPEYWRTDPDLDALRNRSDFQLLLKDLEFAAVDPFAR